jgi:hypothetical protein
MIKESANAKTYYRMEIEGFGSFFRSLGDILSDYIDKKGHVRKKHYTNSTELEEIENALETIEDGIDLFQRDLKVPPKVIFGLNGTRNAFTKVGYDKFKETIDDMIYSLKYLGYNVKVFTLETNKIVYKDKFQVVYIEEAYL